MPETITLTRYRSTQIQEIDAHLAYLDQMTPGAADRAEPARDTMAALLGGIAITAAISSRLAGYVLCLPAADAEADGIPAAADLDPERSREFTRSALRVLAPVVPPVAEPLGVREALLAAARDQQRDGRVYAVLPAGDPANRAARAEGWHEVLRGRSGSQLLLHPDHPDHPALTALMLQA